ncbi:MAG: hypothetical protein WCF62_04255, partial [Pseudolabrys sp.]
LYRPNDSHWNIAGNELAARLILQHVSAQLRPVDKSDVRFTPKSGQCGALGDVCFVPIADIATQGSFSPIIPTTR